MQSSRVLQGDYTSIEDNAGYKMQLASTSLTRIKGMRILGKSLPNHHIFINLKKEMNDEKI